VGVFEGSFPALNDGVTRCFVPEVNNEDEDLGRIVTDFREFKQD
jgi:hypothetical protein